MQLRRAHLLAVHVAALLATGCHSSAHPGGGGAAVAAVTSTPATPTPVSAPLVLLAGAASCDMTPPVGTAVAGVGVGPRRLFPPNFDPNALNMFLAASTGVRDPIKGRALVLSDGTRTVALVAVDAIGVTAAIVSATAVRLQALGSALRAEDLMVFASHTHSGPGALTEEPFWAMLAVDWKKARVFDPIVDALADCIHRAESNLRPAVAGAGTAIVASATHNRRVGVSKVFTLDSVDPELVALRVDDAAGAPIATVFNYAIHGTCLDETNLLLSADVAGEAAKRIEAGGGGVALFANAPEGDVDPSGGGDPGILDLGTRIATAALRARSQANPRTVELAVTHEEVDLGDPSLFVDPVRFSGSSGSLSQVPFLTQVMTTLRSLGLGAVGFSVPLPPGWTERSFRFQAVRLGKIGIASFPGEPIHTIGLDTKAAGKALGFEHVLPIALCNGHASYVVTESEWDAGGYEALMTLFGRKTGAKLFTNALNQLARVKP